MKLLPMLTGLLLLAVLPGWRQVPAAQAHDPEDAILEQVGVDEKLGGSIPLHLSFKDQAGRGVRLSRYFTGTPVILTLNYYSCPTLCPLVFRNLIDTAGKMGGVELGTDFRIVTVSIDDKETLQRAAESSAQTYGMLRGISDPSNAWPFLIGNHLSIQELSRAVGVRYTRLENNEYAHPNVVIVVTPEGRISRYLYGLEQAPQDLKLALLEASDGKIGKSQVLNRVLLYCFHYDPVGKKYVLLASRVMTGAMGLVLLLTLGLLAILWRREKATKGEKHA